MTGDCHARFYERRRVKIPPPTHHTAVHEGGFTIARDPGTATWHTYRPSGSEILVRSTGAGRVHPAASTRSKKSDSSAPAAPT